MMQDTPGYHEEGKETEAILSFIDKGNADYMAADLVHAYALPSSCITPLAM